MKFIDRTGEVNINFQGLIMTIVSYRNANDIDVVFEDNGILYKRNYRSFKKGSIKNLYYPSVCGVGYFGIGTYKSKIDGKSTKSYESWSSMLKRCYDEKELRKHPSYRGCSVDERWHNFQVFAEWFEENYNPETMKGWHLDKDLKIKGNRVYSPDACVFVPQKINVLFIGDNRLDVTNLGISHKGEKFMARVPSEKGRISTGTYDSLDDAKEARKRGKKEHVMNTVEHYSRDLDSEIYKILKEYKHI